MIIWPYRGERPGAVTPEAMGEYMRCYCCKGTIRAICEDYRAAAGIDLDEDRADDAAGHKLKITLLALWGAEGTVGKLWDVLETWRAKADNVSGKHYHVVTFYPRSSPNSFCMNWSSSSVPERHRCSRTRMPYSTEHDRKYVGIVAASNTIFLRYRCKARNGLNGGLSTWNYNSYAISGRRPKLSM